MMINDNMAEYCVQRASRILNKKKKALNGSRVLIMGVAYKQDIDDYRESPAIRVINALKKTGAETDFFDPFISEFTEEGKTTKGIPGINEKTIKEYDLVIITTAHTNVDYDMIQKNAKAVFDTKNAMKNIKERNNIEVL